MMVYTKQHTRTVKMLSKHIIINFDTPLCTKSRLSASDMNHDRTMLKEHVISFIAMETLLINTLSCADRKILKLYFLKIKSKSNKHMN